MAGHHHHQGFDRTVLEDAKNVSPFAIGQSHIDEDQIPVVLAEVILSDSQGRHADHVEPTTLELDLQRPANDFVVFDDQNLLERHMLVSVGDDDFSWTHEVRLNRQL